MNAAMIYLSSLLNPIAFALGAGLTVQVWRMKNPVCLVFALLLLSYQTRNLITAITIPTYSSGLVRPLGLLVWSNIGRMVEIFGTSVAMLYFAGKIQLLAVMAYLLTDEELHAAPRPLASGELPPDFWQREFRAAVRSEVREQFLKPKD